MKVKSMLNLRSVIPFFSLMLVGISLTAQDEPIKHKPSLTLGVSANKFMGDVGKQTEVSPLIDTRLGYYLAVEQRFGKVLGVSLGGMYGKLAGTNNVKASHLNFQSTVMQGELLLTANFDKVMKNDPAVSPFLNAGIGYLMFNPYGDLKRGDSLYYYWNDGSIRNQPDLPANQTTAGIIKRDYTYETQLKDSSTNYSRASLVVPVGGGLNFHIGERWVASFGVNYVLCMTDYIDNHKNGGNDSYLQANVGIQYEFRKKSSGNKENEVDFYAVDHLDADNDGVGDDKDRCLGTPKGVVVDGHGCPFDTDNDGVADYMDKEPKSKKGAKVDGYGVTIDENILAQHQLEWDSIASERSDKFNETPSLEYLKQVENQNKNPKGNANTIPADLKQADINSDGYISADEITRTIDAFFEGTNDFTVDSINRLIDYFFEQ